MYILGQFMLTLCCMILLNSNVHRLCLFRLPFNRWSFLGSFTYVHSSHEREYWKQTIEESNLIRLFKSSLEKIDRVSLKNYDKQSILENFIENDEALGILLDFIS